MSKRVRFCVNEKGIFFECDLEDFRDIFLHLHTIGTYIEQEFAPSFKQNDMLDKWEEQEEKGGEL